MRVQASTARESCRHRSTRRRPAGGERNEERRGAGNKRPTIIFPNQGLRGGRILSRMPHHAGPRQGNAETHYYVRTVASKFNVEKTSTTPVVAVAKPLSKDDAPKTEAQMEEMRVTPYLEAVGALMCAATMTRLDVAYATHRLGRFNDNPGPVHGGRRQKGTTIYVAHEGHWVHLRRNAGVVHKNCRYGWTPISPLAQTLGI